MPNPVTKLPYRISVVVPTLNEEGNIALLVERLHNSLIDKFEAYEVIFIDDHSTDRTVELINSFKDQYPVKVFFKRGERGKARSLWQGFAYAAYELIATMDGDLQYRPEDIPGMADKLLEGFDLVQSRRSIIHQKNGLRNLASKVFHFFFIRVLHSLDLDTQSSLKLFHKKILNEVSLTDATPWTFDLEFLIKTRSTGYKITTHDIVFESRMAGLSKINIFRSSWEIGLNAIKLKLKHLPPVPIPSLDSNMLGAGTAYKGRRYITHSNLPHHISALQTLVPWQKIIIFGLLATIVACFIIAPLRTSIALIAVLSFIYFLDVIFNFFLVAKSLNSPPEIKFTEEELKSLDFAALPVYSILCPLYREAHVLPLFLQALEKLDWPKDKLDVLLLLEEDDLQTLATARSLSLPSYIRVLVVPHSMPKTKPKACNYGLAKALGEYLVVYDAEDIPDPEQLKKAYLGFKQVDPEVRCLQAKLNYFNPHQNLLTRLFTAEYSLWFDIILPGLQSINGYIPLGGTSNHFRTKDLRQLHGWDPFNVTEDCDLGARLFMAGFKTAIIDSTTLEEANSNLKNWLRQRSRWIKGYMQTYLVHMRHPVRFLQESGIHAIIFQLVVGGKIAFMLINPLLWVLTILYFAMRATLGPMIEALYPPIVFYIAVTSLLLGNFMYFYYYMIGSAKRGHWSVIKYVYLVPIYWLMTSVAAIVALYQLIVKPHFWEKTHHGLHLAKESLASASQQASYAPQELQPATVSFWQLFSAKLQSTNTNLVSQSTMLLGAAMFANFLNFVFNAFLGRTVSLEQLGIVALISNFLYLGNIFMGSLGTTVNHRVAILNAAGKADQANSFLRSVNYKVIFISLIFSAIWIASSIFLKQFFHLPSIWILLLFTPAMGLGLLAAANKGYLQGRLKFGSVAFLIIVETASKMVFAAYLVLAGYGSWVYLCMPLSVIVAGVASVWFKDKIYAVPKVQAVEKFPTNFFSGAVFNAISTTIFLSLDLILVKHYLPPSVAGQYVLLSLVGKMVFFFGSLPSLLMITLVSRDLGLKRDSRTTFRILLAASSVMILFTLLALGVWGNITVPILLGDKTLPILNFLRMYVLSMGLFTLSNIFVVYHLARRQFEFPFIALITSLLMGLGIILDHSSIGSIVWVIFYSSALAFGLQLLMHMFEHQLWQFKLFLQDLTGLFTTSVAANDARAYKRILIFNWRDTKHVFAGGAEVYIHELAKNWVVWGHEVTLFCGNDSKSVHEEVVDGVKVIRHGGFYMVYFWAFVYYMFRFRGKFDVIIDCENGIPFFTPLYAREPVLCLIHHVHQEIFRKYLALPLSLLAQFLEKIAMPIIYRNTKFITVSPSTKQQMEELGLTGTGIEIVYNGVDLQKFVPGPKAQVPTILYLGRLKEYKSIDVLIKAFKSVLNRIPQARLMVVGTGEEAFKLRQLSEDLGIGQAVEFTGRVDEERKISLLQKAWVFVNPSFIEGWGITTIEANACAVPVIAADVPGLQDSVRNPHTGYLVKHGDYEAFAGKIIELIENPQLRISMGNQALLWARNFDWSKTSHEFLTILKGEKRAESANFLEESQG